MENPPDILKVLFPIPSPPPRNFGFVPRRIPGITHDSTKSLLLHLKDNHSKRHIFFNDRHFHNHASHHLIAIYALGADRKLLHTAYQSHVIYQRHAFPSPGDITEENWKHHLGDDQYYQAYLKFFTDLLLEKDIATVFEEYIISKDANIIFSEKTRHRPYMLSRYLGGFLHPLIHTGYGAEFGLPGMWAEGLAEACVQHTNPPDLIPESLFDTLAPKAAGIVAQLASLALSAHVPEDKTPSVHALTILARIANDPSFTPAQIVLPPHDSKETSLHRVAKAIGDRLIGFLNEWTVGTDRKNLEAKVEEVIWMNCLVYAVGGWSGRKESEDEKKEFNADFFLMHLVTSSLFLPSLIPCLDPHAAVLLLRSYFLTSLALYISRGRPALPIGDFYQSTNPLPQPPGVQPTPSGQTYKENAASDHDLRQQDEVWAPATKMLTPNPWLAILQTTLVHHNEHLCKLQRTLAHFAQEFGHTPPGTFSFLSGPKGLEGADVLDGTLFIRVAGLTANRLGWMREGQDERGWDTIGFFNPEESK